MSRKPSGALKQATINLRVLAAASLFASKDETRHALQGVCIEVEERAAIYIGTDGHRLIAYRDVLGKDEDDNTLLGAFTVPAPHCKIYKLDKEDDGRGKLIGGERLTMTHNQLDVTFAPIDAAFPDWRKAIPREAASGVVAQFNLKFLADLHKFCKALDLGQPFIAPNGDGPAPIWFSGHRHVMGIIMPVRAIDEMATAAPKWARQGGPKRDQGDIEDLQLTAETDHDPETGEVIEAREAA